MAALPGLEELSAGETETLRRFLRERLAAAVDDILGEFGRTVSRYREQIDRQRWQLHGLEEERTAARLQASSWVKPEGPDAAAASPADVKTEVVVKLCVAPEPSGDVAPEPSGDVAPEAESSDTDDSGDYWRGAAAAGPQEPLGPAGGAQGSPRGRRTPTPSSRVRKTTENLKRHLGAREQAAASAAPFRCSVCGRAFTLRGNLRTHMRIHSGERPHSCGVCGKSFGRRATLVRHVRGHTGEKPFSCAHCGRGFVEKGNLTVHLRTHTGERPYRCSGCGRRFSQRSCFHKHSCQRRGHTT